MGVTMGMEAAEPETTETVGGRDQADPQPVVLLLAA
jgi:hypothetical protein